jgi:hypothetical protein
VERDSVEPLQKFEVFRFKFEAGARLETWILKLGTLQRLVRTLAPP